MISQLKILVDEFKYGHCFFFWSMYLVNKWEHYFKAQSKNIEEIYKPTNMNIYTHGYMDIYVCINADIHIYSEGQKHTQKKVM